MMVAAAIDREVIAGVLAGNGYSTRLSYELTGQWFDRSTWAIRQKGGTGWFGSRVRILSDADATGVP